MINIKLDEHSVEDVKEIEKLRTFGLPEDVIQMAYNNTQNKRRGFINKGEIPPDIRVHEIKCLPQYFREVAEENKRFEIRLNDRNYQTGDMFILQEWSPQHGYTGKRYMNEIKYVLQNVPEYGLQEGYCIFGW